MAEPINPWIEAFGRPTWRETRAPGEARELRRTPVPLDGGAGRNVVVVPGFFGSDASLEPLVAWLRDGGYDVSVAPLDLNVRGSGWAVDRIVETLDACPEPAELIGHSRGGQQAVVAARRRPDRIRQLITLGTPLNSAVPRHFALRGAVELLRFGSRVGVYRPGDLDDEQAYESDLACADDLGVPWTMIWSASDGFVAPEACRGRATSDVEVDCSHRGLVESVPSFEALAAALNI